MAVIGKGPNAFEASIAAIGPGQVITAAGDSKQGLWVNTWEIDSDGVKPLDQVGNPKCPFLRMLCCSTAANRCCRRGTIL
jgi:hypothetical protein